MHGSLPIKLIRLASVTLAALVTFALVAPGIAAPTTIHWATPVCNGSAMTGDVVIGSDGALTGTIYFNGQVVGDDKGKAQSVSLNKSKTAGCGAKYTYVVVVKGSFIQSKISHVDEVDLMFASLGAAESAKRTIECTAFHIGCK